MTERLRILHDGPGPSGRLFRWLKLLEKRRDRLQTFLPWGFNRRLNQYLNTHYRVLRQINALGAVSWDAVAIDDGMILLTLYKPV